MELVLGVIDLPYVDAGGTTTGEVAGYLERRKDGTLKYGVMTYFYAKHEKEIQALLVQSVADTISNVTAGAPISIDPFDDGLDEIKEMFSRYLESEELRLLVPEVPTQAAQLGVSKRFKRKYGPPRPSFIDSGLYQASFKPWIEGA